MKGWFYLLEGYAILIILDQIKQEKFSDSNNYSLNAYDVCD